MKQQEKEKEYETYVKEKTPVRKPGPAMAKAFVTGGINAARYALFDADFDCCLIFHHLF